MAYALTWSNITDLIADGKYTQSQLAFTLGCDPEDLTVLLAEMTDAGLLLRVNDFTHSDAGRWTCGPTRYRIPEGTR